jgi:hypothetical protein
MAENAALTGMPIVSHIHPNFLGASINSSTSEKKWYHIQLRGLEAP